MSQKVSPTPYIPNVSSFQRFTDVQQFIQQLVNSLKDELSSYATRLNVAQTNDGTEQAQAPILFMEYAKASLPTASVYKSGIIMVTDDVGGYTPAFSDGTNWRRVADRNIIS